MQELGYVKVFGEIILVLFRSSRYGRRLKIRNTQIGTQGVFLEDESAYLEETPNLVEDLLKGEVISL